MRKRDIGEADRIYTFYTLERGKVKAIARGVRKSQAKLAGHLENFCLVDFTVMKNRGMGNIASSIVENDFSCLRNDFDVLSEVFGVINIFDRMIEEGEEDKKIFLLLLKYFAALNANIESHEVISQGFLFKLLGLLGYGVSSNFCVHCKRKIENGENYFDYQSSGISCGDCSRNISNKTPLSDNVIKLIRIFSFNQLKSLRKLKTSKKDIQDIKLLSNNIIKWIS